MYKRRDKLEDIILFVFTFVLVYGVYALMILNSKKRLEAYKSSVEIRLLENKYKVNIKKFEFKKLARTVLVVNTLDICITAALACLFSNWILQIVAGFFILLFMILISYSILGHYLKRQEGKM